MRKAFDGPATLTDEDILEPLVALNAERAEEEQQGLIRWLRPEFQNPSAGQPTQANLGFTEPEEPDDEARAQPTGKQGSATPAGPIKKIPWPKTLPEQIQAIRQHLLTATQPLTPEDLGQYYTRANLDRIAEVLDSLVIIGAAAGGRKFCSVLN